MSIHASMRFAVTLGLVVTLAACASLPRTDFTAKQQSIAQIPGIPNARLWADASADDFAKVVHMNELYAVSNQIGAMNFLALSGGAADGAFGAGVLTGWTDVGKRPEFVMVSGVSAGALIAPLAFLGPDYDDELVRAWTSGIAESVGEGGIFSLLFSQESRRLALFELVSSFTNEEMLKRIAEQHRRGKRLVVVTTNLDAQRPVVWDLGAIAASGHPKALELFRNILTASASIPGAFEPTLIEVEANGQRFAELHVDGGATMQVFTIPETMLAGNGIESKVKRKVPANFYIIMNNRLTPEFQVVQGATVPVLARSLSSLIKTHARLTLVATHEFTRSRNIGFNLAYINDDFPTEPKSSFATAYMRSVFKFGYDKAKSGRIWKKEIPFLNGPRQDAGLPDAAAVAVQ
ncbi:MAG TPA: patatin-like phospholipase family protein [Hyphomicrobiales bacterium]|nr:patatin-like phospholipase family protein [Hyphomicrobiales bacterium]